MKAIIPVAGIGAQLRPHTHTQPKPLIPVAGKPILGHIIENLIQAGVTDQVFVVGYLREKIEAFVRARYAQEIRMEFVVQEPRRGLGHAIWVAREQLRGNSEILIVLGDTIFGDDTQKMLDLEGSVLAVHPVEDPREFGIAVLDARQEFVAKLAEKPQIPTSNLALVGMYKLREVEALIAALEGLVARAPEDDLEIPLTDALMEMIRQGVRMRTLKVENWFDCGRLETLLQTNRILLGRRPAADPPRFPGSVIIPPVDIAEGCQIEHSIIGPFVAVGEHARIVHSMVEDSILGAYSRLETVALKDSVVGNDTSLSGRRLSINLGDNTEIDFDR
ncbi:MAG: sugar phosphate nucleotidyltransferase [Bacteroidia bacterium]|nr:sugar phosphate nucleotidyltransferase [Bacteroidia bacterium]